MNRAVSALAGGIALGLSASAFALDFASTARPVILYDAPSTAATRQAIAGAGVPFELVVDTAEWAKVRGPDGKLGWLEKSALGKDATVMVKIDAARVRTEPRADAPSVLTAVRGVLLNLDPKPAPPGWLAVRHASGGAGWLRRDEVWGE